MRKKDQGHHGRQFSPRIVREIQAEEHRAAKGCHEARFDAHAYDLRVYRRVVDPHGLSDILLVVYDAPNNHSPKNDVHETTTGDGKNCGEAVELGRDKPSAEEKQNSCSCSFGCWH